MTHPERWTFDWFYNRQTPEPKGKTMNASTLLELVAKWEKAAEPPQVENGAEEAKVERAAEAGRRNGLRTCAEDLRLLVKLLG